MASASGAPRPSPQVSPRVRTVRVRHRHIALSPGETCLLPLFFFPLCVHIWLDTEDVFCQHVVQGRLAPPSISADSHHDGIGEVDDLPPVATLALHLGSRSGVLRCDGRAPVGDRVVVFEPPSLKPSHGHDATSTTDGARIARNSLRNCRMSKLALAKGRYTTLRQWAPVSVCLS